MTFEQWFLRNEKNMPYAVAINKEWLRQVWDAAESQKTEKEGLTEAPQKVE